MTDWQITAKTFMCDAIAEEVTLLIYPDWKVRCTGLEKYTRNRKAGLELLKRGLNMRKILECKGIDCPSVIEYKLKLQDEEMRRAGRTGELK